MSVMTDNPYAVLGVSENATPDEVKKAYRKKARENHPDLNPNDPAAAERMNRINEAYDRIMNPEKYAARDRRAGAAGGSGAGSSGYGYAGGAGGYGQGSQGSGQGQGYQQGGPVSYTHLDVYKRQIPARCRAAGTTSATSSPKSS